MPSLTAAPALSADLAFVARGDLVQRADLEPTDRPHRRCNAEWPGSPFPGGMLCSRTDHGDSWHVAAVLVLADGETITAISNARLMDPAGWLEVIRTWGRRPAPGATVYSAHSNLLHPDDLTWGTR